MDRQPASKLERQPSVSSDEFEIDIIPDLASAFPRSTLRQLHGFVCCDISHLISASQGNIYFMCTPVYLPLLV